MSSKITDNRYVEASGIALGTSAASLYRFGALNSSGLPILATALGQQVLGTFVVTNPLIGQPCEIQFSRCSLCVAGGTVAINDEIVSGADARGVAKTVAGQFVAGIALSAATVGQTFVLWLAGPGGAAGVGISAPLSFGFDLASLAVNGNRITGWTPGFAGRIRKWEAIVTTAGTGAGANVDLNWEIDTVDATGGVLTLTLANTATIGAIIPATAFTAGNAFGPTGVLDMEAANSTAFTAGRVTLLVYLD